MELVAYVCDLVSRPIVDRVLPIYFPFSEKATVMGAFLLSPDIEIPMKPILM